MQHYTLNTISTSKYCNVCGKVTQHAVSGKRIGHCLEHEAEGLTKKQEALRKKLEEVEEQPGLDF